jgi:hypothetical protein
MRKFFWAAAGLVVGLAACGAPEPAETPSAPAPAVEAAPAPPPAVNGTDIAAELTDCAGALAAAGNLDPMADPSKATPEENAYFVVLALMDKEPGLEGAEGRKAAVAAKAIWAERPPAERAARAGACLARFGG